MKVRYTSEEDMKVRYTYLMLRGGHEGEVYIPYAQGE